MANKWVEICRSHVNMEGVDAFNEHVCFYSITCLSSNLGVQERNDALNQHALDAVPWLYQAAQKMMAKAAALSVDQVF